MGIMRGTQRGTADHTPNRGSDPLLLLCRRPVDGLRLAMTDHPAGGGPVNLGSPARCGAGEKVTVDQSVSPLPATC